jgi:glycine betaine/choline ABC-type transport system substrate-binding protein
MKRRNFLTNTTLAATGVATLSISSSCNPTNPKENIGVAEKTFTDNFELNEITVTELQEKNAERENDFRTNHSTLFKSN